MKKSEKEMVTIVIPKNTIIKINGIPVILAKKAYVKMNKNNVKLI